MKAEFIHVLSVLILTLLVTPVLSANEDRASFPAFDKFERIVKRNIFDPNRRPEAPVVRNYDQPQAPPEVRERVFLIGTMITNRKNLALFESDQREHNTDAQTGTKLAGFTVQSISTSGVKLVDGERSLELPVGAAIERVDRGEWKVVDESPDASLTRDRSRDSGSERDRGGRDRNRRDRDRDENETSETEASTSSGASDASNSVLQRMMERRKREMGQ
jgi:hypothetical protein